MADIDTVEAELWATFDDATKDAGGYGLNRNDADIKKTNHYKKYRANLQKRIDNGEWTDTAAAVVKLCVRKAAKAARILADEDNNKNCTAKYFKIGCAFSEAAWRVDSGGATDTAGIIC
jgi:hypothetical protein